MNILVCDDDKEIAGAIEIYLRNEGYTVFKAFDGAEALDVVRSQPLHLIIMDVMMPKMDGWQVCKEIRQYSSVPILMLTAKSDERDELLGFELGVDEYISKPFSPKILVARVEALLKRTKGNAKEIKEILEDQSSQSSIYIMVSTLKYLKKGGRITPAAAAIGTLLKIKPVLQIQGGKLDQYAKVMNEKVAKLKMIEAMKKDLETRFKESVENGEMNLYIAYTNCKEKAEEFATQVKAEIPSVPVTLVDPLSLSVACHIGPGALAVACTKVIPELSSKKN